VSQPKSLGDGRQTPIDDWITGAQLAREYQIEIDALHAAVECGELHAVRSEVVGYGGLIMRRADALAWLGANAETASASAESAARFLRLRRTP
jgi:hypothetical protein